MRRLFSALFLLPLVSFAQLSNTVIPGRVYLRHFESDGVGFNGGYTTIEGMMAVPFNYQNIPFIDLRYHVFNRGRSALNAGLGYRFNANGVLLGFNGYYDARWTTGQTFSQLGAGVEMLSRFLDFRANGYFPLNLAKDVVSAKFAGFFEHGLGIKVKERLALTGGNAELGAYIGRLGQIKMYLAGGAYYFKRQECNTKIGKAGRLRFSWLDNIWAQFSVQHDDLYKTNYQGTISFNWPFWQKPRTQHWNFFPNFEALMIQPVERQEVIVLCDITREVQAKDKNGELIFIWFVDNTNVGGNGTFEDPFQMLLSAQNASSSGQFIYVFPGDGTTTDMDAGIVLKSNQYLFGAGVEQIFPTSFGPVKVPPQASSTPNITNGAGVGVTLANNNVVRGFNIVSPTSDGIAGTNIGTTLLDQLSVTGAMANGINVTATGSGTSNLNIIQTTITGSSDDGISLNLPAPSNTSTLNVIVDNSRINTNSMNGLALVAADASTASLNVQNSTFNSNAGGDGISLSLSNSTFTGTINNNTLSSNSGSGVDIGATSSVMGTITVSNNTIDMPGNHAINFASGMTARITATLSDNTLSNGLMNGIAISATGGSAGPVATISSNSITSFAGPGISIISATATPGITATISGNTINNPASNGILMTANTGVMNVTGTGNNITAANANAIEINGTGSATLTASFSSTSININAPNTAHGVRIDGASGSRTYNLTFSNNTISGGGAFNGIFTTCYDSNTISLTASGNTMTNFSGGDAFSVETSGGSPTVTLNLSSNNGSSNFRGIVIHAGATSNFTSTLESNTISSSSGTDFDYHATGTSANQLTVTDNSFADTAMVTTSDSSTLCLIMTNNTATTYTLTNPGTGTFDVQSSNAPSITDMQSTNSGTFSPLSPAGVVGVTSCP